MVAVFAPLALTAGDYAGQRIRSVVRTDPRSGRLVRSVVVTPKSVVGQKVAGNVIAPRVVSPVVPAAEANPAPASGIDEAVDQIATEHSLPPELIHSVIKVESNYNPFAVSAKGALGLMQLIPATARRFGVADVFNPVENIQGGAKYLKYLLSLYHNDYRRALAAYNAGENAVARYGNVPPYRETRNYLQLVGAQLLKLQAESARQKPRVVKPVETPAGGPNHIQEIVEPGGAVRYVTR